MPEPDDYAHVEQRRRARPWAAVGLLALAGVAACVLWMPSLALYLVAVAVAALTFLRVVFLLSLGLRARALGAGVVALVVCAAVVVPWWLADAERTGSPRWTLKTAGVADNLYVDGRRLLFSDDEGLHALDMSTGKVVWSFDGLDRIATLLVAGDGHVLVRSDRLDGDEAAWLSPDGELLWKSRADAERRHIMGLNLRFPLASSHGVIVFRRCAGNDEDAACAYVGVGPGGKKLWEADGYDGIEPEFEQQDSASNYDEPRRLPEVVVVDSEPDKGGAATVVGAKDGAAIADIDVASSVVVAGGTVAYDSGPAPGERKCRMHGLSADRKVDWSATAPCLYGQGVLLGERMYGVDKDPHAPAGGGERPIDESFMIDIASGRWAMVGGLEQFNNHADASVGVPGADIVVQRDHQHLTAVDPDTGVKRWDLRTEGDGIPGASSANGATVVLSRPDRGHNPFFADERAGGMAVWVVDTATGQVTGRRTASRDVWNSIPAGPGRAVLVYGEELSLIGSAFG